MMTISLVIWGRGVPISRGSPYRSYTGIGNMTSSIESNAFHGGTIRVAFDRDGFVGLYSRRNHRYMIEECYQQLSMASAAIWCCFSVDKVASRCFCMLHHCALYKTRFGIVSQLSWKWLPKTEAYGRTIGSLHWNSYFLGA